MPKTERQKNPLIEKPAATPPKLVEDLDFQETQSESVQIKPTQGEQSNEVKPSSESLKLCEEEKALVDKPVGEDVDTKKGIKVRILVLMQSTDAWVCNSQSCEEKWFHEYFQKVDMLRFISPKLSKPMTSCFPIINLS
uniref:Uncharacterized protein n=1 Tax=Rhabditophanes sp. KR3021 TaxID=114890 RepID=A0AC35TU54_9BILA